MKRERIDRQVTKVIAEPRYVKWPPSFYQFLAYHRAVSGPLGKVARFAMLDRKCWPVNAKSKDYLWRHIELHRHIRGTTTPRPDQFALTEAFRLYHEFVASRKQIPARTPSGSRTGTYYLIRWLSLTPEAHKMLLELCDPRRRPEAVVNRPAVIEEAIRAYHAITFGKRESNGVIQ